MPRIDVPIKRIVQCCAMDWVKFLQPECPADWIKPLKTEKTPKVQSRMDEIFAIDNPEKPYIVHFEPQAYPDKAFPVRCVTAPISGKQPYWKAKEHRTSIRQPFSFFRNMKSSQQFT